MKLEYKLKDFNEDHFMLLDELWFLWEQNVVDWNPRMYLIWGYIREKNPNIYDIHDTFLNISKLQNDDIYGS